jgi:hypothetical protein
MLEAESLNCWSQIRGCERPANVAILVRKSPGTSDNYLLRWMVQLGRVEFARFLADSCNEVKADRILDHEDSDKLPVQVRGLGPILGWLTTST